MYDKPFQWGSKRIGPDLARVGGKYSDDWHVEHLKEPRAVVPTSIMPAYAFLFDRPLDYRFIESDMKVQSISGVPYSPEMIANAKADLEVQAVADDPNAAKLQARYPKAVARNYTGNRTGEVTEGDALVAYLQMLGTLVDFKRYDGKANVR
jgi:cytochrome c oxidase cbb3-type subunit 2